jgi:hypothetical protein
MEKFKENLDVASSINILIRITNKQTKLDAQFVKK